MDHLHRMLQALDVPKPRKVRCLKANKFTLLSIPEELPLYKTWCAYSFPDKDHYTILIKHDNEWKVRDDLEHVDQLGLDEKSVFLSSDAVIVDATGLKYPGLPLETFLKYWGPPDEEEEEEEEEDDA